MPTEFADDVSVKVAHRVYERVLASWVLLREHGFEDCLSNSLIVRVRAPVAARRAATVPSTRTRRRPSGADASTSTER